MKRERAVIKYSTAVHRYPSGRFGIVGSVPAELTEPQRSGTPQYPPVRVSKVWDTEEQVIQALLGIGISKFQLADCSWYHGPPDDRSQTCTCGHSVHFRFSDHDECRDCDCDCDSFHSV